MQDTVCIRVLVHSNYHRKSTTNFPSVSQNFLRCGFCQHHSDFLSIVSQSLSHFVADSLQAASWKNLYKKTFCHFLLLFPRILSLSPLWVQDPQLHKQGTIWICFQLILTLAVLTLLLRFFIALLPFISLPSSAGFNSSSCHSSP